MGLRAALITSCAIGAALACQSPAELGASVLSAHADEADGGHRLVQRPDYEVDAALVYQDDRFSARAEVRRIGGAVDLAPSGGQLTLPGATDAGAVVVTKVAGLGRLEVTGAVDNLTDEVVLPQAGLPAPGRTVRVGLRLRP